jgi:hypothetical protein
MNFLLFFIAITILVFLIWNIILGNKLSKKIDKKEEISDSKYWELKFKTQYMISTFAVLIALAAYLGYNSIDKIKQETKNYLVPGQDSIKKMSDSIKFILDKINEYKLEVATLKENGEAAYKNLNAFQNKTIDLNSQISSIKNLIDTLNSKNKVKQNFYVVDSLFQMTTASTGKKYYYNELKTSLGDILPRFKRPPVVVPLSRSGCEITIDAKNSDYFTAYYGMCNEEIDFDKPFKLYFSILIIETPN